MKFSFTRLFAICGCAAACLLSTCGADAQNLTLEGQTGGFITPTAYVVYSAKDKGFSHPVVGYHFVNASNVIGNIHTFNITEGYGNRAEVGYSRSVHTMGNSPAFSSLWDYSGMNIVHGKVVAIKDGEFGPWTPGVAVGGLVRTSDRFVSGALNQELTGTLKNYTNGDVYAVATKTWLHPPVPFLLNFGLKFTNASIFGLGGQATRFGGRLFGGLGIPLPGPFHTAIVPAIGFTQEPPQVTNLSAILYNTSTGTFGAPAHLPTTMDYAVRITQKDNPHFAFDVGVGHVAGKIGNTAVATGLPAPYPPIVVVPVDLKANSVFGLGLSFRY
ncbi:MAG: DUF3034 family protein [Terracidiphilus sp.]|nr:DUF3034 family protein [Terracidiphilus sp.]